MFGFDAFDGEETLPSLGSARMIISDEKDPLFFSATWTIRCRIDGRVLFESRSRDASHPTGFIAQWSRFIIRRYAKELRQLGVDVKKEYVMVGGKEDELSL